jgi:iron(III) transport system substrate-binding protein
MGTDGTAIRSGPDRRQLLLTGAAFAAMARAAYSQTGDAAAFEGLIKAAKQEGAVVLDGPPIDEVREAISNGFRAKYAIPVSYISSGSSRSGARVRAERAAGRYLLDVFISGSDTPLLTFLPSGWLDPVSAALVDPEVTDTSKWRDNRIWYVDPNRTIVRMLRYVTPTLAINTKIIKPGEISTWKDVIDAKWRGRLLAKDPSVSGAGASMISYFYIAMGADFVKALYVDQKPTISRDSRQAAQSLAVGNQALWVGADQTEATRFQGLGYPIEWVFPSDGPGIVSGGWGFLMLMNKAPNPNAAKLLVNWMLSRDGQTALAKHANSMSLRTDIEQPWVKHHQIPKDGAQYIDSYDYKFVLEQRDPAFEKVKQLLGF